MKGQKTRSSSVPHRQLPGRGLGAGGVASVRPTAAAAGGPADAEACSIFCDSRSHFHSCPFFSHQALDSPCLGHPHGPRGHTGVRPASGTFLGKKQTKASSGTKTILFFPAVQPHGPPQEAGPPTPHILDSIAKPLMIILDNYKNSNT